MKDYTAHHQTTESEKKTFKYEKGRLAALTSFHIADTLNEKEYDDIAKLASAICGTPISLVTFIDEDYQWFKAKVGTDYKGNLRELSFCEHTILKPDEVMVVEDATADPRFADNPLVAQEPNIRFYAGAPFTTEDGYTIGTVCVFDVVPRKLNAQQIETLEILSSQVLSLLNMRKMSVGLGLANQVLKGRNKVIKNDKARLQGQLQQLIAERFQEMTTKNEELERINKELESFSYISSHDLQEPLRKIQTFASWLTLNEIENLSAKGKEYLGKINSSSERMQCLIRDLLQYSKAGMSTMIYQETSLQKLYDFAVEDLSEEIEQKAATIDIKGNGRLFVVEYQFRQLFYNLLSNALKFAKSDVVPHIKISLAYICENNQQPAHFKIEFTDNGTGFDNQYNERIFNLFQRLVTVDKVPGTGIGLTIVKKIVHNHGGTISAIGNQKTGAVFTICIPDKTVV